MSRNIGFKVGFAVGSVIGVFQDYWYFAGIDYNFYNNGKVIFSDNSFIDFAFRGKFILFMFIVSIIFLFIKRMRSLGFGLLISTLISLFIFFFVYHYFFFSWI